MRGLPQKLGASMKKLNDALGSPPRDRLSHSDSSSPMGGQKQAADKGTFKPRKP